MSRSRGHRRRSKPECGVGTGNRRPELGCRVGALGEGHVPARRAALAAAPWPTFVALAGVTAEVRGLQVRRIECGAAMHKRYAVINTRSERRPRLGVPGDQPSANRARRVRRARRREHASAHLQPLPRRAWISHAAHPSGKIFSTGREEMSKRRVIQTDLWRAHPRLVFESVLTPRTAYRGIAAARRLMFLGLVPWTAVALWRQPGDSPGR